MGMSRGGISKHDSGHVDCLAGPLAGYVPRGGRPWRSTTQPETYLGMPQGVEGTVLSQKPTWACPKGWKAVASPDGCQSTVGVGESSQDWLHAKTCQDAHCGRCWYQAHQARWQRATPIFVCLQMDDTSLLKDCPASWLASRELPTEEWGIGCLVCSAAGVSSPLGTFTFSRNIASIHLGNFTRHAASPEHKKAAIKFARHHGLPTTDEGVVDHCAPSLESFQQVLEAVKQGAGA